MKNEFPKYYNYNKRPMVTVEECKAQAWTGWEAISETISHAAEASVKKRFIITIECYLGVNLNEILSSLIPALQPTKVFLSIDAFKTEDEINTMVQPDVTDDRVFGYLTRFKIGDFLDNSKTWKLKEEIASIDKGIILIAGIAASTFSESDLLIYADMPRWEGQLRFRRNEASNLGISNTTESAALQYRGH